MNNAVLQQTVKAFNLRRFDAAARHAAEGLADAQGRDEAFWMGLGEACEGYALLMGGQLDRAEQKMVAAMQKLRNFGFRYENFEVTVALAGVRQAVEEIRAVRARRKRVFDVSLLPQLRLAAKADD
ncbi:MAG: hypothetical protein IH621_14950 [Krumholzibacteria bacterium]|nr:hypothetical protein [Candidatus Krumholzibacteria bacterium]